MNQKMLKWFKGREMRNSCHQPSTAFLQSFVLSLIHNI